MQSKKTILNGQHDGGEGRLLAYEAPQLQRLDAGNAEGGPFATGVEATNGPS